jgi:uncharacterized protein DUF87
MAKTGPRFKTIDLGTDLQNGKQICLRRSWLETHFHVLGPPGSGKTRLLLWIFEHLARMPQATIVLINPKGALARMARDWAIGHGLSKRVVWFDPGDKQFVIGYNPLYPNGLPVATHAKAAREAVRSAWGQNSFDQTPQLARLLYLSLAVSLALGNTLLDSLRLLRSGPVGSRLRKACLTALASGAARGERDLHIFLEEGLTWFDSLTERRQEEIAASTLARLESFVCDPAISRILIQSQCLNLSDIIAGHKILLVNLEIGRPLRMDDVKLLGRFLVNDLINHVFSKPTPSEPIYLILDEVQNFATRDLCSILDMGRELGLHCVLAHQTLGQLHAEDETGYLYSSVRGCARTKFYFGGLSAEDLDPLVRDACIEQYDPYKIKDELTTLLLEPFESVRETKTEGWTATKSEGRSSGTSHTRSVTRSVGSSATEGVGLSEGETIGHASSLAFASGGQASHASGETLLPTGEILQTSHEIEGMSDVRITGETDIDTRGYSQSIHVSRGVHTSEAEGSSEGTQDSHNSGFAVAINRSSTRVPFYEYKKHWRPSSRTFESEQEFLTTNLQKIKGQPQAHVFLKVPGKPGLFLALPRVRTPWISARQRAVGLERVFDHPYYSRLVGSEIHGSAGEHSPPNSLPAPKTDQIIVREPDTTVAVRSEAHVSDADENFAGPEIILKPRKTKTRKR